MIINNINLYKYNIKILKNDSNETLNNAKMPFQYKN